MKFKITSTRRANKDDISKIVEIHKACVSKTNAKSYTKPVVKEWLQQISEENVLNQMDKTVWLVLIKEDNIIGFCQYNTKNGELYQMQILPEYQGKGHGKYLYAFIEKDFVKNKKSKITLFATLNAVEFYESVGFKCTKPIEFPLDNETVKMIKMCKDVI